MKSTLLVLGIATLFNAGILHAQEPLFSDDGLPSPLESIPSPTDSDPGSLFGDATTATNLSPNSPIRAASLDVLYQNQWLRLNNGSFTGTATYFVGSGSAMLANARVVLAKDGRVVRETMTDSVGEFQLTGVSPGYYALMVQSQTGLAILGASLVNESNAGHLPNEIEVRAVSPVGSRLTQLLQTSTSPNSGPILIDTTPPTKDPIQDSRAFSRSARIALNADQELEGKIARSGRVLSSDNLSDITVYIMQENRQIASTQVKTDGSFRVAGMEPGCFGLVAIGPNDLAVVGFCVADSRVTSYPASGNVFVSMWQDSNGSLNVESTASSNLPPDTFTTPETQPDEPADDDDPAAAPAPAPIASAGVPLGGYGPVIGGGGGNGLNFAGLGPGLIGAAGLAGVVYAISEASDDDPVAIISPQN